MNALPSLPMSPKHSGQNAKTLDSKTLMFQAEGQMGGLESILEEPGFQENEVPYSTQIQLKKNVREMATPHTIDHHWPRHLSWVV